MAWEELLEWQRRQEADLQRKHGQQQQRFTTQKEGKYRGAKAGVDNLEGELEEEEGGGGGGESAEEAEVATRVSMTKTDAVAAPPSPSPSVGQPLSHSATVAAPLLQHDARMAPPSPLFYQGVVGSAGSLGDGSSAPAGVTVVTALVQGVLLACITSKCIG